MRWSKCLKPIAFIAALPLIGCSILPTSPAESTSDGPILLSRLSRGAVSAEGAAPVNLYNEEIISTETGGQLTLLDVTLDIPPGAVPNDTLFSIFIPDDSVFYNEFGTDGLVFTEPVTVTMSYRDADLSMIDESTVRIALHNGVDGAWESVECTLDLINKTVTGQLHHFSAYGLISDVRRTR